MLDQAGTAVTCARVREAKLYMRISSRQQPAVPAVPAAGGGGRRAALGKLAPVVFRISNLIFGCFGSGDRAHVHKWTILYRGQDPELNVPGQIAQHLPVLLGQDWNSVDADNGRLGSFDTREVPL